MAAVSGPAERTPGQAGRAGPAAGGKGPAHGGTGPAADRQEPGAAGGPEPWYAGARSRDRGPEPWYAGGPEPGTAGGPEPWYAGGPEPGTAGGPEPWYAGGPERGPPAARSPGTQAARRQGPQARGAGVRRRPEMDDGAGRLDRVEPGPGRGPPRLGLRPLLQGLPRRTARGPDRVAVLSPTELVARSPVPDRAAVPHCPSLPARPVLPGPLLPRVLSFAGPGFAPHRRQET